MPRMISTTVYLTDKQRAALKRLSDASGVPQAELIRRGVEFAITEARYNLQAQKKKQRAVAALTKGKK